MFKLTPTETLIQGPGLVGGECGLPTGRVCEITGIFRLPEKLIEEMQNGEIVRVQGKEKSVVKFSLTGFSGSLGKLRTNAQKEIDELNFMEEGDGVPIFNQ